jgi:hypothetical protein
MADQGKAGLVVMSDIFGGASQASRELETEEFVILV